MNSQKNFYYRIVQVKIGLNDPFFSFFSWFSVAICYLSSGAWAQKMPELPVSGHRVYSGGETTVFDVSQNAFSLTARNLSDEDRRGRFFIGNSFFNKNWVVAPASTADRDGLGPLFNAKSCSSCHLLDGRGHPPEKGKIPVSLLFRLSIVGETVGGGPKPHPIYGQQLATQAVPGVDPEASILIEHETLNGTYPDGTPFELMKPIYRFKKFGYVQMNNFFYSPRVAPAVFGVGLLESIPEETIRSMADPEDIDGNGISGRVNEVWDHSAKRTSLGRFGWKANQPSIRQQVADAFREDIGITSSLFPVENYSKKQNLANVPNGGNPEIEDRILADVIFYCQTLAVPGRRKIDKMVLAGEKLFYKSECTSCHVPQLKTGKQSEFPELSEQTIYPFSDLLLHDMGSALADNRPDFKANGQEWRTPPLWGIGLIKTVNKHTRFLHDGRARNLEEAILWHGGEAMTSKLKFMNFSLNERKALIGFLQSL